MNNTFVPNSSYRIRKWYVIDANERSLGRISTVISNLIQGKHKPDYHPSVNMGDYIIIVNAEKIIYEISKVRYHVYSPGRPGRSLKRLHNCRPQKVLERSIKNMLPKGSRCLISNRVRIYNSSTHPHSAQNPILLKL